MVAGDGAVGDAVGDDSSVAPMGLALLSHEERKAKGFEACRSSPSATTSTHLCSFDVLLVLLVLLTSRGAKTTTPVFMRGSE